MIWVGTNGGGVNKFDPKQLQLRHFQINAANAAGSRDNAVWTFYEDRDATLWIGGNGKLTKFKRNRNNGEGNFTPYLLPTGISPDVNIPQVRAICEEGKTLWIGTVGYGFGKFDRVNETFTFYTPDSLSQKNRNDHNIYSLYADPAGALWMAINKGASAGLAKMWRDKQLGMQYKNHFRFGNNPRGKLGWVLAIHPSRRSRELWLGTWSEGLLLFDPQQEIFTSHFNSADSNSLCHNTVISIYEDHAGIVWVGTYGGGLDKVDLATAQVTHYKTGQGLPDNVIYGILPDDFGNLWLSTNKGLSRFDPHNESFLNFDVTDGLQGKEFNLGAAFKARNGELFFGGNNGFNCFHPADVLNTTPPQIALTAFKKFGKEVVLDAPLTDLITLTLSHRDDFFAFEFAALHYKNPARNRYAYKLEGFDDDWIEIGNKREASYTSLDPGEYTFRVKAANSDGVWNQQGLAIQVKITPPYWQTWWFFLLLAGMAGGTIYWLLHSRVRRVLALERLKIQEREQLQKKIAADFHDDLGHRLTNISWAANILKQQAPALPPALLELLDKIAAHAAHLSTEKDEFVWKLDPQKDSLYHLAEQWKDFSDELFNNTDIAFQLAGLSAEFERIKLPVEWKKHLYLIFKEAMHNVLKHAAGCKNVTLAIKLQDESLQVSLTDDGHGFHPANERHGHGLRNMRQRTEFLGATIEIGANDGGGTCVCFTGKLPKRPVESMAKMPILGKLFRFIQNSVHKPRKGLHPKHAA
jgi:signal transduction histidine kinase/streptogramin lyase